MFSGVQTMMKNENKTAKIGNFDHWYYAENAIKIFFCEFFGMKMDKFTENFVEMTKIEKNMANIAENMELKKNGKNDGWRLFQLGPHTV